jgi:hypothetical protein
MTLSADPELERQIAAAKCNDKSVSACFILKRPAGTSSLEPVETGRTVRDLLDRVTRSARSTPREFQVFPYMQSFSVDAAPDFIEELARQDEIGHALANEQPEDLE